MSSRWCNSRWLRRKCAALILVLFTYIVWQNAVNQVDVKADREMVTDPSTIRGTEVDTQYSVRMIDSSSAGPPPLSPSLSPTAAPSAMSNSTTKAPSTSTTKIPTTTATLTTKTAKPAENRIKEVRVWLLRQRKRRTLITETCQSVNHSGSIIKIPMSSHIYVDKEHEVLYCAIPKAACSSWKVALAQLTGKFNASDHKQTLNVHDDAFMASIGLHQLRSYSRASIVDIIKNYRKFLVVRHPFERLVSAYVDKFEKVNKWTKYFHHKFGREIMQKYRQNPTEHELETGRNVTFEEFVRLIMDSDVDRAFRINEHWDSFQSLCLPCVIPYDLVVDYDTIEEDNRNILQGIYRIKYPEKFFPHQNPNPGSAALRTSEYISTLSEKTTQRLIATYSMDFTMFNYTWPR